MRRFTQLYRALDSTTSSRRKIELMAAYFAQSSASDAAWAVYFLAGGKLKRLLPSSQLRAYAREQTQLPDWLFEESYQHVGDLAETIALLLPPSQVERHDSLSDWVEQSLLPMRQLKPEQQLPVLHHILSGWSAEVRFVCLKLVTGGLRVGVSRLSVTRALALTSGLPNTEVAQRLMGYLSGGQTPSAARYTSMISQQQDTLFVGQPYPFFLAQSLQTPGDELHAKLGPVEQWQLEYKWDGIRAQLVHRQGQMWLWSRGEELMTDQFPELSQMADHLPDGIVLDGEILVWHDDNTNPASFAELQKRLGRKQISAKLMADHPVVFMVYDMLELDGVDCRQWPLSQRRAQLALLMNRLNVPRARLSPVLSARDWQDAVRLQNGARERRAEGLMLKSLTSRYGVGRTREAGLWFKFKLDPLTIDAVLIYAQKGHGRRANLYTDYTFAVWDQPNSEAASVLVPIAKAYSGLTDEEIRQVDAVIKKTAVESFGPVKRVTPQLVFELGFEGIMPSRRHKSGVALRFPRMLRWRRDKPVDEADTLAQLKALL